MDIKKKKIVIIGVIVLLLIIVGRPILWYCMRPDGSTMASREEMLNRLQEGTHWTIVTERLLDDYIITGAMSDHGQSGIAVFVPKGNGKYRLQTHTRRDKENIVICGSYINDVWYDFIWFQGAQTERAEITYTVPGKASQSTTYLTDNSTIICSPTPYKDYTLYVAYFDSDGNKYE